MPRIDRLLVGRRAPLRATAWRGAVGVGGPVLVALALDRADTRGLASPALVYLLAVAAAAAQGRAWPALVSLSLSVAALGIYHVDPSGTLWPASAEDRLSIVVFLAVGLAVALVVARAQSARREAQSAQRRLSFLAEAHDLLSRAGLDYEKTLDELAHLAVPAMADWCTVDILSEDGSSATATVAHTPPVRAALAENLRHQGQPDPSARAGVAAVIRTASPELYPFVDEEVLRSVARGPQHLALLRGVGARSMMIVPLMVGTEAVGALTFTLVRRGRRYGEIDLALAIDLARRAGNVIHNVRLYEERSRAARNLERSLLPAEIPRIPGVAVVARFYPVKRSDLVGGDFYDVFRVDDGWALVIGDVAGKGVDAAALTGLARHTIRATALADAKPSHVLSSLNEVIIRQGFNRFCTVAYARLALDEAPSMTLCCGGHPLPLILRANGSVDYGGEPGTLLGVFSDPALWDVTVPLASGDTIVLYTDGILDEREALPEERLASVLRRCVGKGVGDIADEIERATVTEESEDDRAFLVVRLGEELETESRMRFRYGHEVVP